MTSTSDIHVAARWGKPMPSDGFSGFDEWLDFRVKAALACAEGHRQGRSHKILRAVPLSVKDSGQGLWALSDGEYPPTPFFLMSKPGRSGSRLGVSTDAAYEQVWNNEDNEGPEHHGNALVELIAEALKKKCERSGAQKFDLTIDAPLELTHVMLTVDPEDFSDVEKFEKAGADWRWTEPFDVAWKRSFSAKGPLLKRYAWRVAQGETTITPTVSARSVTVLSNEEVDPEFECDTNVWGQSAYTEMSLWLIETSQGAPFLFSHRCSQSPHHSIDEVDSSESIKAKGQWLWGSRSGMHECDSDEPNIFTELLSKLPTIKESGLSFDLGEPVSIVFDPVFEGDVHILTDVLKKPWNEEEDSLVQVWARIEAQLLKEVCPAGKTSKFMRPRL